MRSVESVLVETIAAAAAATTTTTTTTTKGERGGGGGGGGGDARLLSNQIRVTILSKHVVTNPMIAAAITTFITVAATPSHLVLLIKPGHPCSTDIEDTTKFSGHMKLLV